MPQPVILDNTVLSNLAAVDRTDLPSRLWGDRITTTKDAIAEHEAAVVSGLFPTGRWNHISVLTLTLEENEIVERLPAFLAAGERSCIAAAIHRQSSLVTDDLAARRVGVREGLTVTGTLGILRDCVRQQILILEEANDLLSQMIDAGYYSPVQSLDQLL